MPAVAADSFDGCLARLRAPALKTGVSAATFDTHTATLAPDMSVLDLLDFQPEFRTPIWDYMAALVDDERVTDGQAGMERWRADLQRASARYGVDPAVIAAVWGVESNYGQTLGERSLLVSLSTLSCYGRRQAYFRASSSPRSRSSRTKASRPRSCGAPGPALSARPSSCRRRICGWRWTATATAVET